VIGILQNPLEPIFSSVEAIEQPETLGEALGGALGGGPGWRPGKNNVRFEIPIPENP
jgi:hypothetical protein